MVKLFVEGGGDGKELRTECRHAFSAFLQKAGFCGHMPRIIACGTRKNAFDDYCVSIMNGENAILLVDSEAPVVAEAMKSDDPKKWQPWAHLKNRDSWACPSADKELDCHLMVELMETWFFADTQALEQYYGQNFKANSLSKNSSIENISKKDILNSLRIATRNTQKGAYNKGAHSFEILALIDPAKVAAQSKWAKRFITALKNKMEIM